MRMSVHHGPGAELLRRDHARRLFSEAGRPFHGIAAFGLLAWLGDQVDGPSLWTRHAAGLHDPEAPDHPDLSSLRDAASRAGVLSFEQSVAAASTYLTRHVGNLDERASVRLWAVKEGRVSSVWEVNVEVEGADGEQFVLNVARDTGDASRELVRTSRSLECLSGCTQVSVARVHEITEVTVPDVLGTAVGEVAVTRNRLVSPAREIHRLGDGDGDGDDDDDGGGGYALVEAFLTDESDPARIRAIRGVRTRVSQAESIDHAIEALAAAGTSVQVDNGDLVWDGRQPVVVAVS